VISRPVSGSTLVKATTQQPQPPSLHITLVPNKLEKINNTVISQTYNASVLTLFLTIFQQLNSNVKMDTADWLYTLLIIPEM